METESMLLWGLIFGSIGLGYFTYGRRRERVIPKYCGLALIIFPYFVANLAWLVGIGIALLAAPFIVRE